MKTFSISKLANAFGLSRSTLLYYDRIGLITAPKRTPAGYRVYTETEYRRLEQICMFRGAGLPLADIQKLLANEAVPSVTILEKHLAELGQQILHLKGQQRAITDMLKTMTRSSYSPVVDIDMWVDMLKAAGMDKADRAKWHTEFERNSPDAHHEFLMSLGISQTEAREIRKRARLSLAAGPPEKE